jgi:hypothetical protein
LLPHGETERAGAAAEVDDGPAVRVGTQVDEGGVDEEFAADPGHEDAGAQAHPDAAEVGVTDDLLQRFAPDAAIDQPVEVCHVVSGGTQHGGLVLGEDAAGTAQPDDRLGQVGNCHDAMS